MNTPTHYSAILTGLLLLLLPMMIQAQQTSYEDAPVAVLIKPRPKTEGTYTRYTPAEGAKTAHYYRHHKALPATFSGYLIELTRSDRPLKRSHEVLQQFGKVFYDQLDDGTYSYCIVFNFKQRKAAEHFLEQVIRPKAADARIVHYKKGIRKTK
ncbi:MAG: hypothetical protein AAGG75_21375 [Bacteroidota bacterium]